MSTTARSTSPSPRNGAARAAKSARRSVASRTQALQTSVKREGRALGQRTRAMLASATRATRQHPWAAAGVVAASAALIGGALFARKHYF